MRTLLRASIAAALASVLVMTSAAAGAAAATPPSASPLSCNKLAAAASPTRAFASTVTNTNPAISEAQGWGLFLPTTEVIRGAGGLTCEWSNGRPYNANPERTGYVGVRVEFMHDAADGYWRWARFSGLTTPEAWFCTATRCTFNTSTGGDWLYVTFEGARSETAALAVAQRFSAAIQLAGQRAWAPTPSDHPLGNKCEQVVPIGALMAAVGSPITLEYVTSLPGWSPYHESVNRIPAPLCIAVNSTGSYSGTQIRTLPSGEWAFTEVSSLLTTPMPMIPFTAVALPPGDRAFIRCDGPRTTCVLDAILAGHWIQVTVLPDGGTRVVTVPRTQALADILRAAIVEVYT